MTNTDFVLKDIPLNLVPVVAAAIEDILNTNCIDGVPFAEPKAEKKAKSPKKRESRAKKEKAPAKEEAPAKEDAPEIMPVEEFRARLRAVVDTFGDDENAQRRALAVFKDVAGEKATSVKTLPEEHRAEVIKLLEAEVAL